MDGRAGIVKGAGAVAAIRWSAAGLQAAGPNADPDPLVA